MPNELKHPCFSCRKADLELVNMFEYGCDNPCKEAKLFFKYVNNRLDDLIDKARNLLEQESKR